MSVFKPKEYYRRLRLASLASAALLLLLLAVPAAALETIAKQAILMDADTGTVLFEKNADDTMPPSSMSKLMTVYMVFERLKSGSLTLDDELPVSKKAWRKGGSKMYVLVGKSVRVEDLLRGIIVQSGNDATIVVAEGLSGTEEAFATEMTKKGRKIGLENSVFRNASGWPEEGHYMTARDIAYLSKRTIDDFPDYYHYYAEKNFTFSGIRQGNRNPLVYRNMGADGLKTGHTEAGGFGLAGSVIRDGRRLILVVNGLESAQSRANESQRLIEWGFREFANFALFRAGETVDEANVWLGTEAKVPLIVERDLVLTLPRRARRTAKVKLVYTAPVPAPISNGAEIAKLVITAPGLDDLVVPLKAGAAVRRLGFLGRISASVQYLLWGGQR
jgi:D-alanyl-D-alanine carboxypeptidase (penicillin-binding protein 5/6)